MNKGYIVSGLLLGDEGKGTICDYLANKYNLKENVRYNGGSQASHTVSTNGITHKFSELGSSFMNDNTKTYLSSNTIVNPFNIITEAKEYSSKTNIEVQEIMKRIFIDENALVVTPYHSLLNKLRELSDKNNRIGSVGTGVSETIRLKELTGLEIKIKDLYTDEGYKKLLELFEYTSQYYKENRHKINDYLYEKYINEKDVYYLTNRRNKEYINRCYKNLIESNLLNIVENFKSFHGNNDVLFEGSQGFLIDYNYGIKPNTTALDTTNQYAKKLCKEENIIPISIGASSAYTSRHGMGLLITYDDILNKIIYDENQSPSYYQGSPRYGWFDCVLARYSQKYSNNDYLFMTQLDRLDSLETLKICESYIYTGLIDEEFIDTFEYYKDNNKIIIKNIKRNSPNLRKYLSKCIPKYIELKGWNKDISNILSYDDIPDECNNYLQLIETLIKVNINYISVGSDRNQKLERKLI